MDKDNEYGVTVLPDGSACAVIRSPLPADHWMYGDRSMERKVPYDNGDHEWFEPPPMPFKTGTNNSQREEMSRMISEAARYAVRAATANGTLDNFDPDMLVQSIVVGFLGYHTPDGLTGDEWANPAHASKKVSLNED